MDWSRVPMLVVVALMLLGVLAMTVWVFRVVFQSMRGIARTIGASPGGPLEELGFTVTSDVLGGVADGLWRGVAMKVAWRMTAAPYTGDFTPPPEFSTTVVAFFAQPLTHRLVRDSIGSADAHGIFWRCQHRLLRCRRLRQQPSVGSAERLRRPALGPQSGASLPRSRHLPGP